MSSGEPDILRYFEYGHLPEAQQSVARPFRNLAHLVARNLPEGAERAVALRKLLEGKDAAVRASLDLPEA